MDKSLCEIVYDAAANAGFLQQCRWDGSTAMVGLQTADRDVLDHLTLSSDTSMTYPSSCLKGLKTGNRVWIGDSMYQVREVVMIADGSEMRATLTLL
jgi:hypothetical protein